MKNKVDPRTGKVIIGKGQRYISPVRHSSPVKKPDNIQQPIITPQQAELVNMDILLTLAKEIGKVIAKEIKTIQAAPVIVQQVSSATTNKPTSGTITIDEGIADVGIDNTDQLKKGDGSAKLAKAETKTDEDLKKSKNKLKALKKGRKS